MVSGVQADWGLVEVIGDESVPYRGVTMEFTPDGVTWEEIITGMPGSS